MERPPLGPTSTSNIKVRVVAGPERKGELSKSKSTEEFGKRVSELGDSIGEIANELRRKLDDALEQGEESNWGLDQIQLSFSLDLEAEAGVIVAKAKTAAGFEVQLTWSRKGDVAASSSAPSAT